MDNECKYCYRNTEFEYTECYNCLNKNNCTSCILECTSCTENICADCTIDCIICGEIICENCSSSCNKCINITYCNNCKIKYSKECTICKNIKVCNWGICEGYDNGINVVNCILCNIRCCYNCCEYCKNCKKDMCHNCILNCKNCKKIICHIENHSNKLCKNCCEPQLIIIQRWWLSIYYHPENNYSKNLKIEFNKLNLKLCINIII